jgi:hypothetical protein
LLALASVVLRNKMPVIRTPDASSMSGDASFLKENILFTGYERISAQDSQHAMKNNTTRYAGGAKEKLIQHHTQVTSIGNKKWAHFIAETQGCCGRCHGNKFQNTEMDN